MFILFVFISLHLNHSLKIILFTQYNGIQRTRKKKLRFSYEFRICKYIEKYGKKGKGNKVCFLGSAEIFNNVKKAP